jgi:fucokinase
LFGGLKLGTSDSDVMLKTKVCSIELEDSVREELNKRLVLVFSGKQRLAKNILTNVLRRWARRSSDIVETVQQLVQGANESVECLRKGDLDSLGSCMSMYWEQKKVMAGPESGVEPCFVKSLLDLLRSKGCIVGGTLCGAGGEH